VNTFVADQAKRLARPNDPVKEFRNARKIARAEINGDSQQNLVVLFTLEQGNNWTQFLAVFSGAEVKPVASARVGGKGNRSVALEGAARGEITISTKSYAPSDALCCPSVPGQSRMFLQGGALVEEAEKPVAPAGQTK